MRLLSLLHRWSGGLIGLLLAVIGVSGAALVWEDTWISLPGASDPVIEHIAPMAAISQRAIAAGATRITFASDEIGLHLASGKGDSGAYYRQDGSEIAHWTSAWSRPELWLFDLHHHLFFGETGEAITGIAALFGLMFVVTGSILWWRSRRTFSLRLWPRRFEPGAIVRHHRDIGIVVGPLLLVSLSTGAGMIYSSFTHSLFGAAEPVAAPVASPGIDHGPPSIALMLRQAKTRFPTAELRRLSISDEAGRPYALRLRQPWEWTPNGRTTLYFDRDASLIGLDDAARADPGNRAFEKLYPLHSAKVGGLAWKLAMTMSGLGLGLLGTLAMWSFWWRKAYKRRLRARTMRRRLARA